MPIKITVNHIAAEVADNATVAEVAAANGVGASGAAIAVNDRLVPRSRWTETKVNPDDNLVIIKAAYGG